MALNAYESFIKNNPLVSFAEKAKSTGYNSGSLKYPLSDDNQYQGKLIFEVIDEEQYKAQIGDTFEGLWSSVSDFGGGVFSALGEILGWVDNINESINSFKGIDKGGINKANPKTFVTAKDFPKISLYLPQALNIMDAVQYDNNIGLGRIGAMTEAAIASGQGAYGVGKAIATGAAESLGAMAGGKFNPTVGAIMAQDRAGRLNNEAAAGIKSATQVAINPNSRTLFNSVPIRQFSFTFTMIATSESEADQIEKIIKAFRTELYPEKVQVGGIDYAYKFPRRFLIRAVYSNKEWPGIKFLPTYLQNFNAVYNPNGMGFHKGGKWTEVQISMTFSESRALDKENIKAGY